MVHRLLEIATALLVFLTPHAAHAQNKGLQVLDFFLQQADREIQRQQIEEQQRQHRQELKRLHQQFLGQWRACHAGDVHACDAALSYPSLSISDRQRLLSKRESIERAHQEAEARAQQARIDAELAEQRRRQEIEAQAERERARELARQREEAEQQRQRAEQAERERQAAEAQLGALHAAQAREEQQRLAAAWRMPELSRHALLAVLAVPLMLVVLFPAPLRRLLTSAGQRLKLAVATNAAPAIPLPPPLPGTEKSDAAAAEALLTIRTDAVAETDLPRPVPDKPRDTPGAIAALELALAYIDEVRHADIPGIDDHDTRKHQLNTLALASKKVVAAERLDPDAVLEFESDDTAIRFTISELKADALFLEGLTHQVYDLKRAVPALVAATKANPQHAAAHYVLGLTHAANYNKAAAIAAFERAVALDPVNLKYRMELDRAQNLSAAEIAGYKTVRAGERILDAGVATANSAIRVWNIFAFTWNVLTFPLRLVIRIAEGPRR